MAESKCILVKEGPTIGAKDSTRTFEAHAKATRNNPRAASELAMLNRLERRKRTGQTRRDDAKAVSDKAALRATLEETLVWIEEIEATNHPDRFKARLVATIRDYRGGTSDDRRKLRRELNRLGLIDTKA